MKAASEEVSQALENAGQKINFDGKPIRLNPMHLNDLPVLGELVVLHFLH